MDWMQKLIVRRELDSEPGVTAHPMREIAEQLRAAGERFDARRDAFALGKGETCRDIAEKIMHFGGFASSKQNEFALKLIEWSKPRAGNTIKTSAALTVPKLFAVMQQHAHLHVAPLKLSRKNQDTLVWIMYSGTCVGKIENAVVTLFASRAPDAVRTRVVELLKEFAENPLEAAKKYGKLSGVCVSCGRDLTDPVSIAEGLGPICARRFR